MIPTYGDDLQKNSHLRVCYLETEKEWRNFQPPDSFYLFGKSSFKVNYHHLPSMSPEHISLMISTACFLCKDDW